MKMPGQLLRRMAAAVCRPETMERLIDPIVADLQSECATVAGQRGWKSRLPAWRGYLAFWKALSLYCLMQTFQPSRSESSGSAMRMWGFSLTAFIVMTIALTLPPLIEFRWRGTLAERVLLVFLLIPQALPLTIPAGVSLGTLCAMRGRRPSARTIVAFLFIAGVATFGVWAVMEWGLPAANQRFRELIFAQLGDGTVVNLDLGMNELGLSRLSQRTDPAAVRHSRLLWALCFATAPLGIFALGLAARVRRFGAAVAISLVASIAYIFTMFGLDEALRDGVLRTVAAWLPNILFMLAGALMLCYRREDRTDGVYTRA